MAILLLAEVAGGQLSDATARALTAALELGGPVDALVAGQNVAAAAAAAAQLKGVAKVRVADDPLYAHGLAEPLAALIVSLAPSYDAIVGKRQERRATRSRAARRDADFRHHEGRRPQDLRAADLRWQRDPDRRIDRSEDRRHRAHRVLRRHRPGRLGADRAGRGRPRPGGVVVRRRRARQVRPAGTDL